MSSSSLYDSVKKSFSPRGENAGGLYNPLKGEPVIFQPVTDTWVEQNSPELSISNDQTMTERNKTILWLYNGLLGNLSAAQHPSLILLIAYFVDKYLSLSDKTGTTTDLHKIACAAMMWTTQTRGLGWSRHEYESFWGSKRVNPYVVLGSKYNAFNVWDILRGLPKDLLRATRDWPSPIRYLKQIITETEELDESAERFSTYFLYVAALYGEFSCMTPRKIASSCFYLWMTKEDREWRHKHISASKATKIDLTPVALSLLNRYGEVLYTEDHPLNGNYPHFEFLGNANESRRILRELYKLDLEPPIKYESLKEIEKRLKARIW